MKGRGAAKDPGNKFERLSYEPEDGHQQARTTTFFQDKPKQIINKVTSPDVGMDYSINPYQGCEHGCIYCYARNSHEYWGFGPGLDFESKIVIKENAADLLDKRLSSSRWEPAPITLSGNTDCYQPVEREKKITRSLLKVFRKHAHPVAMITKNSLVERDMDILSDLASKNLVKVVFSITTLDENIRRKMEPRTATSAKRLETMKKLTDAGIPCGVMVAPIIPGLNNYEVPEILKRSGEAGAISAGYTMVRLNGRIDGLFIDWVERSFPDRASKIINQVKSCHGGRLNDSRWGDRMKGDGKIAEMVRKVFDLNKKRFIQEKEVKLTTEHYLNYRKNRGQLDLFS